MGKRGPTPKHRTTTARRPAPPAHLTPEQAAVWAATVRTEDAAQFATAATSQMLEEYCRRVVLCQQLSALIADQPPSALLGDEGAAFDRLLRAREREARAVVALARSLRVTNQSRITPGAAGSGDGLPPEDDADDPAATYFN